MLMKRRTTANKLDRIRRSREIQKAKETLVSALDFQKKYEEKVAEAAFFLKRLLVEQPKFGLTLGSGLGDVADAFEGAKVVPYKKIPHFSQPTVAGHAGELYIGRLSGVPVLGLKGRTHYYEVADEPFNTGILKAVFPVHVLANLGVRNYFTTNAVGGLAENYQVGDLMVIRTHISLIPNPLLGRHMTFERVDNGEQVWQFQPMDDAYDKHLRALIHIAGSDPEHIHEGTYLALTGPTYETHGESIALRRLGIDAVGMSVAPEVIVAKNRGMTVVGMSCITDKIAADGTNATNHEEVMSVLNSLEVRERISKTVQGFFELYREGA
jgi:purine-nucleoside phosphorylase